MDRQELSFKFAQDVTKQLITLATVILTVTVALATANEDKIPVDSEELIVGAWVALSVSVVLGAFALMALTSSLAPRNKADPTIYAPVIRWLAASQVIVFLVGLVIAVIGGAVAIL